MGREIRRVPPRWEHPRYNRCNAIHFTQVGEYKRLFDKPYRKALDEWLEGLAQWDRGEHPYQKPGEGYWAYAGGPPDPNYYRPAFKEVPTWYQVYETISEGTPVTPSFATKEELVDYLVKHGEFNGQRYGNSKPTREAAQAFVDKGWMVSMVTMANPQGNINVISGYDVAIDIPQEDK